MFGSLRNGVRRVRRALLGRLVSLAGETGAATAEYTLVTLVAATIAFLLLNWAKGGALTDFLKLQFDTITLRFGSLPARV